MSDAPKKIWLQWYDEIDQHEPPTWTLDSTSPADVMYVRSDIGGYAGRVFVLEAALERARDFIKGTMDRPAPVLRQIDAVLKGSAQ